jgi:predicted metal-binding membrane protein
MSGSFTAEQLAGAFLGRRDKALLIGALAAVVTLAWAYLVLTVAHMEMPSAHAAMAMVAVPWTASHFLLTLLMWAVMMVAMMLPSATPMVLTYAAVLRRIGPQQKAWGQAALFVAGYVLVWSVFSFGATTLQWGLERAALLSPMMVTSSPWLGGLLLILAGAYQWAPLKQLCLRFCRSPLSFIAQHWREGQVGALLMGISHGCYCVGCCWPLMLLLFVAGVMNLLWVAAIAVFVLLEKLLAPGTTAGRVLSGAALNAAGVMLLARSL